MVRIHHTRARLALGLALGTLVGCGSTTTNRDGGSDGSNSDRALSDTTILPDGAVPPDAQGDSVSPPDGAILPDAMVPPDGAVGPDVFPPDDVQSIDAADDTVSPPDAPPADVVTPPDAPAMTCMGGLTDNCPAAPVCPDLSDGMTHTVTFTGLTSGTPASCEGMATGAGPDGYVSLTLTAPSDVTLTARPTGMDAVVLAAYPLGACGMRAAETQCSNSSAGGTGGVATLRLSGLAAGTYYFQVASAMSQPAVVQAMVRPAAMRPTGDLCPGAVIAPDGAPTTVNTMGFDQFADVGTTCNAGGAGTTIDVVFSYTLTTTRDVTLNVSKTNGGVGTEPIAVDVSTTCGNRATVLPTCATGNPVQRTFRRQAPGTYYVTVSYNAGGTTTARDVIASVTTAAPTMPAAADVCPGQALTAGMTSTAMVTALAPEAMLTCVAPDRADGYFTFSAPAGQDVLVVANSDAMGSGSGFQLEQGCGPTSTSVAECVSGVTAGRTSHQTTWRRYTGLTAGTSYAVLAATDGASGNLGVTYYTLPASTPTAVTGNDTCATARAIPATGGVFTGDTTMLNADSSSMACGGCNTGVGRDAVYSLTLTAPHRVLATVTSTNGAIDTVLYYRGPTMTCSSMPSAMDVCNDDYYGTNSGLDRMLAAGTYYFFIDTCGAGPMGATGGPYRFEVSVL